MRIAITGHQSLPADTSKAVKEALRYLIQEHAAGDLLGVTCLADGADQLFARAVLEAGGAIEVVIPASKYRDGFDDPEARAAYDDLIASARGIYRLPFTESTDGAHMAGGQAVVDHSDLLIAVWDGLPARGLGGTADVVTYARERGIPVQVVWPEGARRG